MSVCNFCKKQYNRDLVERMLGVESAPAILGYCCAQCYTLATYKTKAKPDSKSVYIVTQVGYDYVGTLGAYGSFKDAYFAAIQVFDGSGDDVWLDDDITLLSTKESAEVLVVADGRVSLEDGETKVFIQNSFVNL